MTEGNVMVSLNYMLLVPEQQKKMEFYSNLKRYLYPYVHSSIIDHIQNMKQAN